MLRRFSTNFALLSMALDAGFTVLALWTAARLRPVASSLPFVLPISLPVVLPAILFVLFPLIWVGMLVGLSVYDGRRYFRQRDELAALTVGSLLAGILMAGVLYLSYREVSRFLFVSFGVLGYTCMLLWRLGKRAVQHRVKRNQSLRKVLIVGAGALGRRVEEQIRLRADETLEVTGFLDDDPIKQADGGDILGKLDEALVVICQRNVQEVVIALPRGTDERIRELITTLHTLPVHIWLVPDYFTLDLNQAKAVDFTGIPMLDLRAPALNEYQRMIKRGFDLLLTILAAPFALPVMGAIALVVRLDSPGPAIFHQKRVGENGQIFEMFKFRSMVSGAENQYAEYETLGADGRVHQNKSPDDPRVTRVGRFLRRSSLDELPQIFNVLRGDMSWVGPRPELPHWVERYELWQRQRFTVPQGITGWWQINGRSDRPMIEHTEDDIFYVRNYSIWLDLKILWRTVGVVLRGKGAY